MYTETDATDRFLGLPDDEIADWAYGVIESICPEVSGHRDLTSVNRFPRTAYLPTPGFWRRTRKLRDALPEDSRVQLAGTLFGAAGMEVAIRSGERAAARVIGRAQSRHARDRPPGRRDAGPLRRGPPASRAGSRALE
jgi:protoporphyrinogen/coproporphyrinogen III oxidase